MQKLIQFHFFTKILVSWFFPLLTGFYSCYLTYRMSPFQKSMQLCLQSAVFSLWKKAMFMPFASPLSLSTLPLHFLPSCSLWPAALFSPAHCPDYQYHHHLSLLDIPAKHKSLSLPCDSVTHVSPSSLTNSMRSHSSCTCRCLYLPVHRPTCLRHSSCYSLSIFLFAKKISHNISCQGWHLIYTGLTPEFPVE